MAKRLRHFTSQELCFAKMGEKWHIRVGNQTHCGLSPIGDITFGVIAVREDYEHICKRCLKHFNSKEVNDERS